MASSRAQKEPARGARAHDNDDEDDGDGHRNARSGVGQAPPFKPQACLHIGFIHPDLGIGGAEKLVVDAAVGLEELGHDCDIITSYHDKNHCFEPTRDGTLKVQVAKTSIPRAVFGAFHLPCAIFRQMSLFFQLLVAIFAFKYPGSISPSLYKRLSAIPPLEKFDVFVVDQLSVIVPLLRIVLATRVIFYCHFPDKDVGNSIAQQKAIERGEGGTGFLRAMYRVPFDYLEEMTISTSDKILVNSEFTSAQFQSTFFRLARIPRTVYPGIDPSSLSSASIQAGLQKLRAEAEAEKKEPNKEGLTSVKEAVREFVESNDRPTLISVNRFEAKKNIALALETFNLVLKARSGEGNAAPKLRLVIAGGWDYRVQDNVLTLRELEQQCQTFGLSHVTMFYNGAGPHAPPATAPQPNEVAKASVVFLPSVPYALLGAILTHSQTRVLLYTPVKEHFGIVPLEAMAAGLPVLATNTGGPTESVVDLDLESSTTAANANGSAVNGTAVTYANREGTGLLRRPQPKIWAQAVHSLLLLSESQRVQIADYARRRVHDQFSRSSMSAGFLQCIRDVERLGGVRPDEGLLQFGIGIAMYIFMMATFIYLRVLRDI